MTSDDQPLWSQRQGRGPSAKPLSTEQAGKLFRALVEDLDRRDYLQESFGYWCVDAGDQPGLLGEAIPEQILIDTGYDNVWPVKDHYPTWDEDTLLDMVEYMFRHVSAGVEEFGRHHTYGNCGWHFKQFDRETGRVFYRTKVNAFLGRVDGGFELSEDGQVVRVVSEDYEQLFAEPNNGRPLPTHDEQLLRDAIVKFRSRSLDDRRSALRNLADILESHRSTIKQQFSKKDEGALFEIANRFWIRHNNGIQQRDYDHEAWWDWLFFLYLSSIRLMQRLDEDQAS